MTAPTDNNPFVKAEPVLAAHIAAAVVAYVLGLLVTHGVITQTHASALTQQVVPAVSSLLLVGLGFVVRRFVSPAAKAVQHAIPELTDAEIKAAWDALSLDTPAAATAVPASPVQPVPAGTESAPPPTT